MRPAFVCSVRRCLGVSRIAEKTRADRLSSRPKKMQDDVAREGATKRRTRCEGTLYRNVSTSRSMGNTSSDGDTGTTAAAGKPVGPGRAIRQLRQPAAVPSAAVSADVVAANLTNLVPSQPLSGGTPPARKGLAEPGQGPRRPSYRGGESAKPARISFAMAFPPVLMTFSYRRGARLTAKDVEGDGQLQLLARRQHHSSES